MPKVKTPGYRIHSASRPAIHAPDGREIFPESVAVFRVRRPLNYVLGWRCGVCGVWEPKEYRASGGVCPFNCTYESGWVAAMKERRLWVCDFSDLQTAFEDYDDYVAHFAKYHNRMDVAVCDYPSF